MQGYSLSIKAFSLLAAALLALTLASGCGGGDSSSASADEITVKTGSLSKKQFIARADAMCKAARSRFDHDYSTQFERNPPKPSKSAEVAWLGELVDTSLLPHYEKLIAEIGALGAPSADKQEVTAFLKTFQRRLDVIHEKPTELSATVTPFAKATALAKAYGANGCANSF
jgi:hypothetical protein